MVASRYTPMSGILIREIDCKVYQPTTVSASGFSAINPSIHLQSISKIIIVFASAHGVTAESRLSEDFMLLPGRKKENFVDVATV